MNGRIIYKQDKIGKSYTGIDLSARQTILIVKVTTEKSGKIQKIKLD